MPELDEEEPEEEEEEKAPVLPSLPPPGPPARPQPARPQLPPPEAPPPSLAPPEPRLAAAPEEPAYIPPWEESSVTGGLARAGVTFPISRLALVERLRGIVVEYRPGQHLDLGRLAGLSQASRFSTAAEVVELARHAGQAVIAEKVHQGRRNPS